MEVLQCWKIVEFPKILIKLENFIALYEAQRASLFKEII